MPRLDQRVQRPGAERGGFSQPGLFFKNARWNPPYKLLWPQKVDRIVDYTEATNGLIDPDGVIARDERLLEIDLVHGGLIIWP